MIKGLAILLFLCCLQFVVAGNSFGIGAIAYSIPDEAYGMTSGFKTKEKAFEGAKKFCREAGGMECKGIAWFEKCGAIATAKKRYGYGYGDTKAIAENEASKACGAGCKAQMSRCE